MASTLPTTTCIPMTGSSHYFPGASHKNPSKLLAIITSSPICKKKSTFLVKARGLGGQSDKSGVWLSQPLELTTPAGKRLTRSVLQDTDDGFSSDAIQELVQLNDDRYEAVLRMDVSDHHIRLPSGTSTGVLRLVDSQLQVNSTMLADDAMKQIKAQVEEVMYMLICRRFFSAGVPMVPRISHCMSRGKLELHSSMDGRLEAIHSPEVLQLVRRYIATVTGLDADSSARDYSEEIHIPMILLRMIYSISITRGYFLKSASLKYALELIFAKSNDQKPETTLNKGSVDYSLQTSSGFGNKFSWYVRSLSLSSCSVSHPKSEQGRSLKQKQFKALFCDIAPDLVLTSGHVTTSPGTLRRLVLEGFAFGAFLWDTEYFVNEFYKLDDEDSVFGSTWSQDF